MPVTLPIEVYEAFEKGLGKEEARVVVKSLETTIDDVTANKWEKTRNELLDRLASKEEVNEIKEEVKRLNRKIDESNGTFNAKIDGLNGTLNAKIDGLNGTLNAKIDELNRSLTGRIDETNKRIDTVMKIQLWIMGLIAVQAVAVIVKMLFSP